MKNTKPAIVDVLKTKGRARFGGIVKGLVDLGYKADEEKVHALVNDLISEGKVTVDSTMRYRAVRETVKTTTTKSNTAKKVTKKASKKAVNKRIQDTVRAELNGLSSSVFPVTKAIISTQNKVLKVLKDSNDPNYSAHKSFVDTLKRYHKNNS